MKYEILIEPDHVLGIAEGDFLFDVACVFIEKALRIAEETNLSKLLADVRKLNGSIYSTVDFLHLCAPPFSPICISHIWLHCCCRCIGRKTI